MYLKSGVEPPEMAAQVREQLEALQTTMGKRLGDADDPLLVSVRSGAAFSMPGMMETVLNVGLKDESVHGLARIASDDRFAWDSYRRLVQMFGETVLRIDGKHFAAAFDAAKRVRGTLDDLGLDAADMRSIVADFKAVVLEQAGREFPPDPREQLEPTIRAVFDSWNSPRAITYRSQERIPADLETAMSVVAMVFGKLGPDSGSGVAFTRDPATGERGVYGDYLSNAQGEDVVALGEIMTTLEGRYRDLCDIEFTIDAAPCGCCRPGSASAPPPRRSWWPASSSTRD